MIKPIRALAAAALAVVTSIPTYAATGFSNVTVNNVSMYGNGALTIWINTPISEPNCAPNATRIDVPASDPNVRQLLAIAMSALVSGQKIWGQVNGCDPDDGMPTIDQSYNSWLGIYPGS